MIRKYRIREGSVADYVLSASPFILLILVASICSAITGTM